MWRANRDYEFEFERPTVEPGPEQEGVMTDFRIQRIYDDPTGEDGWRVLIDRLWPRGISKERADLDVWAKELSPSAELRKWFNHTPELFVEFGAVALFELIE